VGSVSRFIKLLDGESFLRRFGHTPAELGLRNVFMIETMGETDCGGKILFTAGFDRIAGNGIAPPSLGGCGGQAGTCAGASILQGSLTSAAFGKRHLPQRWADP
jgi:hypothetical protein